MTVLLVDSDAKALAALKTALSAIAPDAETVSFSDPLEALAFARTREIDVAFLETETPELSGSDLGRYLKDLYPSVNLIFTSETRSRGYDAMALHASGYLLKPVTADAVKRESEDLRYPPELKHKKRVFAQTFGNFELFADGRPIAFKYTRTKEILALLILNRGAQTTNGEIIATLWEDDGDPEKKASYLSNLRQDLQNTLTRLRITDVIAKQRGSMAIVPDRIECDLYDWLEKKKNSRYSYLGDFMNQYSWAEPMHAEIDEISYAMDE
ncbi:MAG: response regulator [Clostridia bacterium]|nr:response regulator [Clostridia bacterium]